MRLGGHCYNDELGGTGHTLLKFIEYICPLLFTAAGGPNPLSGYLTYYLLKHDAKNPSSKLVTDMSWLVWWSSTIQIVSSLVLLGLYLAAGAKIKPALVAALQGSFAKLKHLGHTAKAATLKAEGTDTDTPSTDSDTTDADVTDPVELWKNVYKAILACPAWIKYGIIISLVAYLISMLPIAIGALIVPFVGSYSPSSAIEAPAPAAAPAGV